MVRFIKKIKEFVALNYEENKKDIKYKKFNKKLQMKDAKIDMEKVKEIGSKAKDKQVGFGLVTLAQSCQQECKYNSK